MVRDQPEESLETRPCAMSQPRAKPRRSASARPCWPALPTMAASGLPGFESFLITGVYAPAGTPAPNVSRLNPEIVECLPGPELRSYPSWLLPAARPGLRGIVGVLIFRMDLGVRASLPFRWGMRIITNSQVAEAPFKLEFL